jgi:hypothetical protein
MFKSLSALFLLLSSFTLQAQVCARNVAELRGLVGNSDLPMDWVEDGKDPLVLRVKNGAGALSLRISLQGGSWADITGVVCRKGDHFMARVQSLSWGPQAPGIVRRSNIKEIGLKFPYQSMLKVSVALFSFEFIPL